MRFRWRRVAAYVITVTLTFASVTVPPARAAVVADVDQEQPAVQPIDGGDTLGGPSHQKVAQVVEVGIAGDLMFVELPIECFGDSTLTIEIQNIVTVPGPLTLPSGTVLASTNVAAADLPEADAAGFRFFDAPGALSFDVKDQFAIVLTATGPGALDSCLIRHAPAGDTYALGDGWFINDGQVSPWNPGGWLCKCDGGTGAAFDYPFRTYMQTPPPPTDADLSITMTLFDLENPGATNTFSATGQMYQLMITNAGSADATGVTIVDTLPPGVTVMLMSTGCTEASGTVTCTESLLPPGGGTFFNIGFTFDKAGSYTNMATVSATETDPDMSDNTASLTTQVYPTADLQFTQITPSAVVLSPGDTLTHIVQFTNKGPDPAGDVLLLHTLPAGTQFVSISSPDTIFCGQNVGDEYGCRFNGGIAVGATRSMTITVNAPTSPQGVLSTFTLWHIQAAGALIYDHPVHSSWDIEAWVVSETVQGSPPADGTITTDLEGDGATIHDPIETEVQPSAAGSVTITEQKASTTAPTSWNLLGVEVVITAPAGTSSAPIAIRFLVEPDILLGDDPSNVQIFRTAGGATTLVGPCATSGTPPQPTLPISPDPCVASRTVLGNDDVEFVVLTSAASIWNFGVREPFTFSGFEDPVRDGTTVVNAGRVMPVKFSLGGFHGMTVLSTATPLSRSVGCDDAAVGSLEAIETVGSGLTYDASTDTYSIRWDTDRSWAGTCRELVLRLIDGSEHVARFQFR